MKKNIASQSKDAINGEELFMRVFELRKSGESEEAIRKVIDGEVNEEIRELLAVADIVSLEGGEVMPLRELLTNILQDCAVTPVKQRKDLADSIIIDKKGHSRWGERSPIVPSVNWKFTGALLALLLVAGVFGYSYTSSPTTVPPIVFSPTPSPTPVSSITAPAPPPATAQSSPRVEETIDAVVSLVEQEQQAIKEDPASVVLTGFDTKEAETIFSQLDD